MPLPPPKLSIRELMTRLKEGEAMRFASPKPEDNGRIIGQVLMSGGRYYMTGLAHGDLYPTWDIEKQIAGVAKELGFTVPEVVQAYNAVVEGENLHDFLRVFEATSIGDALDTMSSLISFSIHPDDLKQYGR